MNGDEITLRTFTKEFIKNEATESKLVNPTEDDANLGVELHNLFRRNCQVSQAATVMGLGCESNAALMTALFKLGVRCERRRREVAELNALERL